MKYVRLACVRGDREEIYLFCLAPVTHAGLAAVWQSCGFVPVSAGFLVIDPSAPGGCRTIGRSDSLNLGPAAIDARAIGMFYGATIGMAKATAGLPRPAATQPTDDGALGG